MDQQRWAAAYYRVDRDSSGVMMRKRQRKKATEQAISHGDPVPEMNHDVVRILDRDGAAVFEQDWGENRSGAMAQESQIVDDLLKMDVVVFRSKYGIAQSGDDVAGDASPTATQQPPHTAVRDPWDDVPTPPVPLHAVEEPGAEERPGRGSAGAS